MKILLTTKSKKNDEYYNRLPPATMVKRIGDYLINNLVDARKLGEQPNRYELVFDMMHMLPEDLRKQMKEFKEITTDFDPDIIYIDNLYISIVTYSNSIWAYMTVNHSSDPHIKAGAEKTIGTMKFNPNDLISLPYCKDRLVNYMVKKVQREFKKYDISDIKNETYKRRR